MRTISAAATQPARNPIIEVVVGTGISILIFWNGQFYGRQVVENYGSCIMECRSDHRVPHPTVC